MKKILVFLFLLLFTSLNAQNNDSHLLKYNYEKTNNPDENFKSLVDDGIILNMDSEIYRSIFERRDHRVNLTIPISNNQTVSVSLEKFDVLSPDAKIVEKSAQGERELDLRNIILSYKGNIIGVQNSLVSVTFYNGKIIGLLKSDNDTYVIGALRDENGNETNDYILYQESKIKFHRDFKCGSEAFDTPEEVIRRIKEINAAKLDVGLTDLLDAKIAIDVDYVTYGVYGNSVTNASAYALALMSATSAVYVKDMNIKLSVGYLRVWTTPDPYTSTQGFVLLNQFRDEWVANQGSVERVVAHLVSRRNNLDVAGIAYLNVLCNTGFGYGLSATLNGNINQLPTYSYDVVVIAHELGHNFGSPHTHNCSWVGGPLDTCAEIEGGCYFGPLHQTVGTIMSYCDITGGSVIMDFGDQPEALMRAVAENASCVTVYDRPLLVAYPNGGETFRTLSQGRIYWGTSLTGNVNLEYTSNNGSTWNTIQNNVPANQREYVWTVPYIGYSPQSKVRVLNSIDPAQGDTSDAVFRIVLNYNLFANSSPPSLTRIETMPTNTSLHRFVWTSAGTHPTLQYKFKIRKIGTAVDYIFTSDNGGVDTAISFRNSFLDSLAQTLGTTGDSVRCSWRGWAYNGYDSASTNNTFLVTFARVTVGINQISSIIPEKFSLKNNYPNPFNPSTVIGFEVANFQNVKISIYDMLGKEVETIVNEQLHPGKYEVTFNGANHASGIYYYRMETNPSTGTPQGVLTGQVYVETKKMILVK